MANDSVVRMTQCITVQENYFLLIRLMDCKHRMTAMPTKEISFNGVYKVKKNGEVILLADLSQDPMELHLCREKIN